MLRFQVKTSVRKCVAQFFEDVTRKDIHSQSPVASGNPLLCPLLGISKESEWTGHESSSCNTSNSHKGNLSSFLCYDYLALSTENKNRTRRKLFSALSDPTVHYLFIATFGNNLNTIQCSCKMQCAVTPHHTRTSMPTDVKSFEFNRAILAFDLLKIVVAQTTSKSGQHVNGSHLLDENWAIRFFPVLAFSSAPVSPCLFCRHLISSLLRNNKIPFTFSTDSEWMTVVVIAQWSNIRIHYKLPQWIADLFCCGLLLDKQYLPIISRNNFFFLVFRLLQYLHTCNFVQRNEWFICVFLISKYKYTATRSTSFS